MVRSRLKTDCSVLCHRRWNNVSLYSYPKWNPWIEDHQINLIAERKIVHSIVNSIYYAFFLYKVRYNIGARCRGELRKVVLLLNHNELIHTTAILWECYSSMRFSIIGMLTVFSKQGSKWLLFLAPWGINVLHAMVSWEKNLDYFYTKMYSS